MAMFGRTPVPLYAAVLLLAAMVAYQAYGPKPSGDPYRLKANEKPFVDAGRKLYAEHCASCHGAALQGQSNWRERGANGKLPAPPHDETGHTWHHPDAALFNLTKYGPQFVAGKDYESDMPGFDGVLSDAEIIAVLSFIKAQWPDKARETQEEINRQSLAE